VRERDVHVHVPEGAVQKDGPSAGLTIALALASSLLGRPVPAGLAATGEVTLSGRVLAVGGIRDKLLAARRAGIRRVLIPADNLPDLLDVPKLVTESVEVVPIRHVSEALRLLHEDGASPRFPGLSSQAR
jgi:ATP-dependent Lon protease